MRSKLLLKLDHAWQGLYLSGWILQLILLWIIRTPPSVDYANWLHQANVLAHYNDPGYSFHAWYTIAGVFIPNGGFVLPAAFFAKVFPLEASGKIILTLYCIMLPLSVRYLLRSFGNQSRLWMISILLLFNISFLNGNIALLMGCPLLFFAIGTLEGIGSPAKSSGLITLTLLSAALSIAHAVCAMAFLLHIALKSLTPTPHPAQRRWYFLWGGLIALVALVYMISRPSDVFLIRFEWGMELRTRISFLTKSFVAGVTFPPYKFSLIRVIATLLQVFLIAALFLRAIVTAGRSPGSPSPMRVYFFILVAGAIFAPKLFLGLAELSQRLIFISLFCGLALVPPGLRWERYLPAALLIVGLFAFPVRCLEYVRSGAMLEARRDFIERTIPMSEPILTIDDDLGARSAPFGYLVPKGNSLIFQSDYNFAKGGYDPLSFRTGYILPRNNYPVTIDSLMRIRKEPDFLAIHGTDIPDDVGYVALDYSSDFGSAMEERLAPVFEFVARREIAPGIYTEVLRREKAYARARTENRAGPAEDRYTR